MITKFLLKHFGNCCWCGRGPETFEGGKVIMTDSDTHKKFHLECFKVYVDSQE